ncbi:MAG: VanW family protein [Candidatus Limnocylindria bacterium]
MTTLTIPNRLMRPVSTRPARRGALIGFAATLIAGIAIAAAISLGIGVTAAGSVLPGVTIGGVELSGLDRAGAVSRLDDALPSLSAGSATIVVDGEREVVTFADLGRRYETEAMVDAALGVGRDGNVLADGLARLRNLANPAALPLLVHAFDADALDATVAALLERFSVDPIDATVTAAGASFTVSPSAEGRVLEADTVRTALVGALDSTNPADVTLELTPVTVPPEVASADAEAVAEAARDTAQVLVLEVPGAAEDEEALSFAPETIASWLTFGPGKGDDAAYALHIDEGAVAIAVEGLAGSVNRDPVNAHITVAAGGGLGGVIAGAEGRVLAVDETTDGLLAALSERGSGATLASLPLVVNVTEPAVTTAHAESVLPQMRMISSWTTYYVPGEGNGWGNNINIPAFDIDGKNLAPGETFSFWGSVGPFTVERGFMYGGAIINGRSTQGVAIGGGVCSTSTTIFNAALRAGLEMGIRLNHFYYIDRYPDGLDATVSIIDDWAQDMTFRNDTANPIVVRGFGGNGSVTFQIWSVPLERSIVITDPVTWNHRRAGDTTILDSSMAPGTARRVEYPHDGHDVSRTRFVYDAAGNLLHRNDYSSSYATVTGITVVGPTPAAPPAEPEPPA